MNLIIGIVVVIIAYLIGSFPTGYILVKLLKKQDIREIGSGSTGATNVKRVLGKRGFFTVMVLDALKGAIPVFLAQYTEAKYGISTTLHLLPIFASVAVIFGHSKSIFLKFTGGKSVATTAGTLIALNYWVAIIGFTIWAIISYTTKYISLASIIVMVLMPIAMYLFKESLATLIYCLIIAIYVIYLHRENIKRLLNGTENKVR